MPGDQTDAQVDLLVDFANSYEVDGTEEVGTPAELARWLADHELLPDGARVSADDLVLAHDLRAGMRRAMTAHHDRTATEDPALTAAAATLPLALAFDRPQPRLVPTGSPVERALGALLVAVEAAETSGAWRRLKLCAAATCQYAFYDTSKNQSRTWCSMQVCGNRQKTRTYRRRQATRTVRTATAQAAATAR